MTTRTALQLLVSAACLSALAWSGTARACSVCGCGDPQLDASDPGAVDGRLRLQLDSEYLTVQAGNEEDPSVVDRLRQYTVRLGATYSPLAGLSVLAQVPFTRKDLSVAGVTSSDVSGLGDVEVGARYSFVDVVNFAARRRQELAISLGTSLPTGSNDRRHDGARIDEHGQLGTGAYGPYAGLHYHVDQGDWYGFGSVSGRYRTTNDFDYRYGPALLWSAHGQYRGFRRVALSLGVDGRQAGPDEVGGEVVANTGGLVLAASPAAYLDVGRGFWFSLRAQLPLYTHLKGEQDVGPTVVAGVQFQAF
jgi:Putative MetA-pathway of phenol degradation